LFFKAQNNIKLAMSILEKVITQTKIEYFNRNGYLLIPNLINTEMISMLSTWADEIRQDPQALSKYFVFHEKSVVDNRKIVARIEKLCDSHEGFNKICRQGSISKVVSMLIGEEVVLLHDKINYKQPQGSNGWLPHQDSPGYRPYTLNAIVAAVAIDPVSAENGCLQFAPGHHLDSFTSEKIRYLGREEMSDLRYVKVEMNPGDVIFFSSYIPHRSDPNMSFRSRRILFATYNPLSDGGDCRDGLYDYSLIKFPPDRLGNLSTTNIFSYE
jgi:2-aminoethylphosphonate dioxygenase